MRRTDFIILFFAGLAVAALGAYFQTTPGYMDADYYFMGGMRLAQGHGFSEMILWNYLDNPQTLPHPSFSYWMPLASIISALGMFLFNTTSFNAARIGFILLAALIPPLTARLAFTFSNRRPLAITSGLLAVFSGFYFPYISLTETFTPYIILGTLFFLTANEFSKNETRASFLLGIICGFFYITRTDGIIWLLIGLIATLLSLGKPAPRALAFYLVGCALISAPWLLRNYFTLGSFFAPGGSRMLWLTSYDQIFSYPADGLTFSNWIASGIAEILRIRIWAAGINLQTTLVVQGAIFLLPFIIIALWQERQNIRLQIALLAWILTFGAMTFAFPFAGARGGYLHAGASLQTVWWALAPLGLDAAISKLSRWRKWNIHQAQSVFQAGAVVMSLILTLFILFTRVMPQNNQNIYRDIEILLVSEGARPQDGVIVANAPGYYNVSQRPAFSIPNGDMNAVWSIARTFGARYLILEEISTPSGLIGVYQAGATLSSLRYLGEIDGARIFEIPQP